MGEFASTRERRIEEYAVTGCPYAQLERDYHTLDCDGSGDKYSELTLDLTDTQTIVDDGILKAGYCNILDNMEKFIFILNRKKHVVNVYGKWVENNGFSKKNFINKEIVDVLDDQRKEDHEKHMNRALEGNHILYEWCFQSSEKEQFMQTSLTPIRDAKGDVAGVIGISSDMSEYKILESALWKRVQEINCIYLISEEGYNPKLSLQSFLEGIPKIISFNWKYPEVVGVRITIDEQVYESSDFAETEWEISEDLKINGKVVGMIELYFFVRKSSKSQWDFLAGDISAFRPIAEKIAEFITYKNFKMQLEISNDRLERVLERITDGFLLLDFDGRILSLNNESARVMKLPKEKVLNRILWDVYPQAKNKEAYVEFQKVVQKKRASKCEEYYEELDKWLQFRLFYSEEGIAIYFSNITEKKQAEEKIQSQNKAMRGMNKRFLVDREHVKQIQMAFNNPVFNDASLEFTSYYEPYESVGGDFINIFEIDADHIAVYIGDVSGHGTIASLTAMYVHHQINAHKNTQSLEILYNPAQLMKALHKSFNDSQFSNEGYFVMFYAVYHKLDKKLTYCTAGFNTEPIVFSIKREVKILKGSQGLPIGQFDFSHLLDYQEGEYAVSEGDLLMLYTDGLEEMKNAGEDHIGKLISSVKGMKKKPLSFIKNEIGEYIQTNNEEIKDDIAYCLVRFK